MKTKLSDETWASLILLESSREIYLEGPILKILDSEDSGSYRGYLDRAIAADKAKREKRIEVTKKAQEQNNQLTLAHELIQKKSDSLKEALEEAQNQKLEALEQTRIAESAVEKTKKDLDYMQQKTQFELMGRIVRVSLVVIMGVGVTTTAMYGMAIFGGAAPDEDTTLLANTWSNMFGILLTNSFSIIGTIMGVKYATERSG